MGFINTITTFMSSLNEWLTAFLASIGIWGALLSCLLIVIESIFPELPLCVFITLEFYAFGNLLGFLISWFFTVIGCSLSFFLSRKLFKNWLLKKIEKSKKNEKYADWVNKVSKLKLTNLAMLVAIPFTPAFAVNIICGVSHMEYKKFLTAIIIGKLFMVYFWGYIGTTLIECLTNPMNLLKVVGMVVIAFILAKVINRYLDLD